MPSTHPPRLLTDRQWRHASAPTAASAINPSTEQIRHAARLFTQLAAQFVLANPHHEPQPALHAQASARRASVLIAFATHPTGLRVILTRRHARLRFGGHIALPGGHEDADDDSSEHTALREAEEEIGLATPAVEVFGQIPPYFTHAGHCITGVIAQVKEGTTLSANPHEVAAIYEVSAAQLFDPRHYQLIVRSRLPYRANFVWSGDGLSVSGPTLSLLIHLYDMLQQCA